MLVSYFSLDRRAVLNFFNPVKSEQFMLNYFGTVLSLRDQDQHCIKCFRTIFFVLLFESVFQVYLYLCPSSSHRFAFFNILDHSNDYPNIMKLHYAAYASLSAYLVYMLHFRISSEDFHQLVYDYYIKGSKTFVSTSVVRLQQLVVLILNAYQAMMLITVFYHITEYIVFTVDIFHQDSVHLSTKCLEFVSMSIFSVALSSSSFLFIFVSYTCIACAVLCFQFIFFRFRETHQTLVFPYCRLTSYRLLRFVHRNIGTMQCIFSLNRIYGPVLFAFLGVNLMSNAMFGIYLMRSRFPVKQTVMMLACFIGQLNYFFGVHLVAAAISKQIHRPYKRIMSLNILIQQCPLGARIRLANAIQTFHIKHRKYGITYGAGQCTLGLVTMMSFTKFVMLYGEILMYQYSDM